MRKRGQIAVEILLALILIVLLGIIIILVLNPKITGKSSLKNVDVTISTTQTNLQRYCEYVKVPYQEEIYSGNYQIDNLRFNSWKEHESYDGIIGNEVDRYTVYVKNLDNEEGYFKVIFYFYDYDNDKHSVSITKRIRARETEKFIYIDKYRYDDFKRWSYEVISETKKSYDNYYPEIVTRYKTEQRCYWI